MVNSASNVHKFSEQSIAFGKQCLASDNPETFFGQSSTPRVPIVRYEIDECPNYQ